MRVKISWDAAYKVGIILGRLSFKIPAIRTLIFLYSNDEKIISNDVIRTVVGRHEYQYIDNLLSLGILKREYGGYLINNERLERILNSVYSLGNEIYKIIAKSNNNIQYDVQKAIRRIFTHETLSKEIRNKIMENIDEKKFPPELLVGFSSLYKMFYKAIPIAYENRISYIYPRYIILMTVAVMETNENFSKIFYDDVMEYLRDIGIRRKYEAIRLIIKELSCKDALAKDLLEGIVIKRSDITMGIHFLRKDNRKLTPLGWKFVYFVGDVGKIFGIRLFKEG